jgi:hypothetical protein
MSVALQTAMQTPGRLRAAMQIPARTQLVLQTAEAAHSPHSLSWSTPGTQGRTLDNRPWREKPSRLQGRPCRRHGRGTRQPGRRPCRWPLSLCRPARRERQQPARLEEPAAARLEEPAAARLRQSSGQRSLSCPAGADSPTRKRGGQQVPSAGKKRPSRPRRRRRRRCTGGGGSLKWRRKP